MKMSSIPDNIRQEIVKLVPSSVVNEISCFVFFDGHPRDRRRIDIAVCAFGEVKEYFQRDLVSSLHLDILKPTEITMLRNSNADPFYLVFGGDQLLILSRGENLRIDKRIRNVSRYEIEDTTCSGRPFLKVYLKDDAVPMVFDENFETVEEICSEGFVDDSAPIITELMKKLTEAKYSVKCNEKMYEKFVNFRHLALFSKYQKINLNVDMVKYKNDLKEITTALKIETLVPWIKTSNKKIVIVFDVTNQDEEPLEDVQVLLHNTTKLAITYTTKLFERINNSPFYIENKSQSIKPNNKIAVSVVIDLHELKHNILSKINFDAVLMFKKKQMEFLLPLERVTISSFDTLSDNFDVLHNDAIDPNTILAILATTEKTDLHLRHIKNHDEKDITIRDIFCNHLNMEEVSNMNNVIIHRKSPYHTLHGIMLLIHDADAIRRDYNITVFTRFPSQVLALIHFIQDSVPAKILITTPNYKIKAVTDEFCNYNEDVSTIDSSTNDTEYATSILNRTSTLLEYLDAMMIKMNSNKNPTVQNKIGKEIHLFAGGVANYLDFRNKILKEADKGVKEFIKCDTMSEDCEPMIID